jgi:hypothetical protein
LTGQPVYLIETLAQQIAARLLGTLPVVKAVTVEVTAVRPRGGRIRRDFRQKLARASVSGARQRYLLGLGSNLGDRVGHLNEAIRSARPAPAGRSDRHFPCL